MNTFEFTQNIQLTAIDKLELIDNFTINFSEEINHPNFNIREVKSFISSYIYRIPKEGLKGLSIESLSEILKSSELKISDEDQLREFLIYLYEKDHSASVLFSTILFCNVGESIIERFIKTVEFDDINVRIWNSICKRILPNTKMSDSYEN